MAKALGAAGRQRAEDYFSAPRFTRELDEILAQMTARLANTTDAPSILAG
jgi:hypothetical protein